MAFHPSSQPPSNWNGGPPGPPGYKGLGDSYYNSANSSVSNFEPAMPSRPFPSGSIQPTERVLSDAETIDLVHNAMYTAREEQTPEGKGNEDALRVKPLMLDFKRSGIGALPDEAVDIFKRDLAMIVLSHNYLTELPIGIGECSKITYLNLRANYFDTFPDTLLKLQLLQILDLSRNRLEVLPEQINKMKSLRVLSVSNNILTGLPHALGDMDSLKILKLTNNNFNESITNLLKAEENAASSKVPVAEHEKEARVTSQVKKFLRSEAATLDSGGESSSESPVDTPRPLKRSTSHRFPVNPAASTDSKSPGPPKPALPNKSHFRVTSAQGRNPDSAAPRQPSGSSSAGVNETARSNEEALAAQNPRARRMGMLHRQPRLGALEESAANRNSLHLRGTSHNSALKEKPRQHTRNVSGAGSNSSMDLDRSQGGFYHRLSSLPEQRGAVVPLSRATEGAKSLLFSLNSIHPYMSSLVHLASADGAKRSSLERVFYNSSNQLDALDQALQALNEATVTDESQRKQHDQSIRRACNTCLVAYVQAGKMLANNARHLVANAEPRYLRMLLILIYGSIVEAGNAFEAMSLVNDGVSPQLQKFATSQNSLGIPKLKVPPVGLVQERSTSRKLRQDPVAGHRSRPSDPKPSHDKSASQHSQPQFSSPNSANGRGATNNRGNVPVANTLRSGDTFFNQAALQGNSHDPSTDMAPNEPNQDAQFEKVFNSFARFVGETQQVFGKIISDLDRRLERARNNNENKSRIELWTRLSGHAHLTLGLCEAQSKEFAKFDRKDPDARNSTEFWQRVVKPGLSFADFCTQVKQATTAYRGEMVLVESFKAVKPCLRLLQAASTNLEASPWKNATTQSPTAYNQQLTVQTQWPPGAASSNSPQNKLNGHHRAHNGSGSGSSPYLPTTPLSAALGPAAAATGPSSSSGGSFDRSFQGDVFQRAAYALNNTGANSFRRNG